MKRWTTVGAVALLPVLGLVASACSEPVGAQGPAAGSSVVIAQGSLAAAGSSGAFEETQPFDVHGYSQVSLYPGRLDYVGNLVYCGMAVVTPVGTDEHSVLLSNTQTDITTTEEPLDSVIVRLRTANSATSCTQSWKLVGEVAG